MVGAAGFEPATWSTQNSRATRLRYTPPGPVGEKHPADAKGKRCPSVDTRFPRQRQCAVAPPPPYPVPPAGEVRCSRKPLLPATSAAKDRPGDPVAGLNA